MPESSWRLLPLNAWVRQWDVLLCSVRSEPLEQRRLADGEKYSHRLSGMLASALSRTCSRRR